MNKRSSGTQNTIRNVQIFAELSTDTLSKIDKICSWHSYEPRELIIDYLNTSDSVFFLVSGEARVTIYSAEGKVVTFNQLKQGEVFGEYPAIVGGARSASVEADTKCVVASISASAFKEILNNQPTVALALLAKFVSKIRALTARVYEFSTLAANNRIQAEILRLARRSSQSDGTVAISPSPTHAEIASRISSHREAVTRELNRLAKLGVIKRQGDALIVRDINLLTQMVRDATGE
jgi:CRP-like cAMP-binding protein